MWFTRLAISRPVLIWMALTAIAVLGLRAYTRLPAELNPKVDIPTLTVTTIYPGAEPPEIESQVSKPLEDAVGTAPGVRNVYSSSQSGVSIISMDFRVGTNLDAAAAEVRGRVEAVRAQLPTEARPPVVAKLDINALPILYLGLECPSLSLQKLRALADNTLRPRLERVSGVAGVRVVGGEQREIHVAVDAHRLAPLGLTIADAVNSIKAGGHDVPGGDITQTRHETGVRLNASFDSLESIANTPLIGSQIALRNARPGSGSQLPTPALTVADVADISDGTAERTEINRINGHAGISLVLTKASDANTVAVVDEANRVLEQIQSSLPRDLHRIVLRDDSVTVRDALQDVNGSLLLGAVLAMVVILFFLHNVRGTLIVSLAIPACLVATFLVMSIAGFTLNQMTLLALSLSVGILVDDSIVVLESITRHLKNGETPREAAYNGRNEIGFADLTTTLVDVVVFVPVAFMGGIVGGFFKQFGLVIVTATLFSLIVSFSLTPMLASRWYRAGEDVEATRGIFAPFERFYRWLESNYKRVITTALRHRGWVVLAGVAGLSLIFVVAFARLGFEFLPGTDQGQITVSLEMPAGASLTATDAVAREVEQVVLKTPEVQAVVTNVGQILGGFGSIPQQGAQLAQCNIRLNEKRALLDPLLHPGGLPNARLHTDIEIGNALRQALAPLTTRSGGRIVVNPVRTVEGLSVPIEIELHGTDIEVLTQFAAQVRQKISTVPGVIDPAVSAQSGKPEVNVNVDPHRAAQFGIPTGQAGEILRDSLAGNSDAVFRESGEEFPIRIRLKGVQRDTPGDIQNIVVGTDAQGQPVTFADIADIRMHAGPANIERENGQRVVSVTANLTPDTPLGNAQQTIDALLVKMPHPGISLKWGGEAETMNENAPLMAEALILAVVLVYIVMASLFNSLGTPFVIMFTLPMALVGALGALVLLGETMSLVTAIGIVMLVGLMGRNAILLLDYTNTLRARGAERNAALLEAGATRLRPILMTTTATIVGMLPVAMRIGRASEIRAPMAIVVIGGLLVSTVLTLVVIPVLYTLLDDAQTRWKGRRAARAAKKL
jgi:HAE1 family hydrophobic/amphiphilic exporter-1